MTEELFNRTEYKTISKNELTVGNNARICVEVFATGEMYAAQLALDTSQKLYSLMQRAPLNLVETKYYIASASGEMIKVRFHFWEKYEDGAAHILLFCEKNGRRVFYEEFANAVEDYRSIDKGRQVYEELCRKYYNEGLNGVTQEKVIDEHENVTQQGVLTKLDLEGFDDISDAGIGCNKFLNGTKAKDGDENSPFLDAEHQNIGEICVENWMTEATNFYFSQGGGIRALHLEANSSVKIAIDAGKRFEHLIGTPSLLYECRHIFNKGTYTLKIIRVLSPEDLYRMQQQRQTQAE